ncbi:uncharacterized protein LOC125482553, partial [Rhincodon typus]|uniref:uncharacterized protein LOC125482553 n=1 Tax=Rhincodon typus TaxID=259920 RepID=UPI002030F8DF
APGLRTRELPVPERLRVDNSYLSGSTSLDPSELTVTEAPDDRLARARYPELSDEMGLRVLWQSGDLDPSESPSALSTVSALSALRGSRYSRRRRPMRLTDSEGLTRDSKATTNQEDDYESSVDERDINEDVSGNVRYERSNDLERHQRCFQDLLSDLQRENMNLQSLCTTLTQEKAHLASTVLEMRDKLQSSSQESLALKLQLDAVREDKRLGVEMRNVHGKRQDMTMEERAQVAEQE